MSETCTAANPSRMSGRARVRQEMITGPGNELGRVVRIKKKVGPGGYGDGKIRALPIRRKREIARTTQKR